MWRKLNKVVMSYRYISAVLFLFLMLTGCSPLHQAAASYRRVQDSASLKRFLELAPKDMDTAMVRKYLGEPIDMGFDYRYLSEELSDEGCAMGAVFHIGENGKIGDRWYGAICE